MRYSSLHPDKFKTIQTMGSLKKTISSLGRQIRLFLRDSVILDLLVFSSLSASLAKASLYTPFKKPGYTSNIEFLVIGSSYARAFTCITDTFCLMVFTGKQAFSGGRKLKRINAQLRVKKILQNITTNPQKTILILGNDANLAFRAGLINKDLYTLGDSNEVGNAGRIFKQIAQGYFEMAKTISSEVNCDVYVMNSFPTLCPIESEINYQINQEIVNVLRHSEIRFIDNYKDLYDESTSAIKLDKIASKKYLDIHLNRDAALSILSCIDFFPKDLKFDIQNLPLYCHRWGISEIDLIRVWPEPISHPINSRNSPFVKRTVYADALLSKLQSISNHRKSLFIVFDDSYLILKHLSSCQRSDSAIVLDIKSHQELGFLTQLLRIYNVNIDLHYTYSSFYPEKAKEFSSIFTDLIGSSVSLPEVMSKIKSQFSDVANDLDIFIFGRQGDLQNALELGFAKSNKSEAKFSYINGNGFKLNYHIIINCQIKS